MVTFALSVLSFLDPHITPMPQPIIHLQRKQRIALLLIITRVIKADARIDPDEICQLMQLEAQYGIHRSLMPEAIQLTLAEAIAELAVLDRPIRQELYDSILLLAKSDEVLEVHEALLLLALRYCLLGDLPCCEVVSSHISHRSGDLGTYFLYFETEQNAQRHAQLDEERTELDSLLQSVGFQLFVVEHIVKKLCEEDQTIVSKMLEYLAPSLPDDQVRRLSQKMCRMQTADFAQQVLVRGMELSSLRLAAPSLLINLGSTDFLRIQLDASPLQTLRPILADFNALVSPAVEFTVSPQADAFRYYSYFRDFFNLLVHAEPKESRLVVWPNKSEFEFPGIGKRLKLNHQEAALYTTILHFTYLNKGLPLCYDKDSKAAELLYRTIYCRKRCIETADVIFPDNLAPIRSKIETKMRTQLEGLDNLEDFIPRNINREGYYRIAAPATLVTLRPDVRLPEIPLLEYKW